LGGVARAVATVFGARGIPGLRAVRHEWVARRTQLRRIAARHSRIECRGTELRESVTAVLRRPAHLERTATRRRDDVVQTRAQSARMAARRSLERSSNTSIHRPRRRLIANSLRWIK
jgi:hypothetical protein